MGRMILEPRGKLPWSGWENWVTGQKPRGFHLPLHSLPSPPVDLQIPSSQSAQKETETQEGKLSAWATGHA